MLAEIVDSKALLETIGYSLIAGIGVTLIFSIAVWGIARFAEFSRDERPLAAGGAAVLSALALIATLAAVVIGIVVMTKK